MMPPMRQMRPGRKSERSHCRRIRWTHSASSQCGPSCRPPSRSSPMPWSSTAAPRSVVRSVPGWRATDGSRAALSPSAAAAGWGRSDSWTSSRAHCRRLLELISRSCDCSCNRIAWDGGQIRGFGWSKKAGQALELLRVRVVTQLRADRHTDTGALIIGRPRTAHREFRRSAKQKPSKPDHRLLGKH